MVLEYIGAVHVRDARVESRAEHGHQAFLPEPVLIGPLPLVLELRLVQRLVVGRVDVMHPRFEAGIHDSQVLVRQGDIEDEVRPDFPYQGDGLRHVVRVDRMGLDVHLPAPPDVLLYGVRLGQRPACQVYFPEHVAHASRAYDEDCSCRHFTTPMDLFSRFVGSYF